MSVTQSVSGTFETLLKLNLLMSASRNSKNNKCHCQMTI